MDTPRGRGIGTAAAAVLAAALLAACGGSPTADDKKSSGSTQQGEDGSSGTEQAAREMPGPNVGSGMTCSIGEAGSPGAFTVDAGYVVDALLTETDTSIESVYVGTESMDFEQQPIDRSCVLDFIATGPVELLRVFADTADRAEYTWGQAGANEFDAGDFTCAADNSSDPDTADAAPQYQIKGWGAVCRNDDATIALLPDGPGTWGLEQLRVAAQGLVAGNEGPPSKAADQEDGGAGGDDGAAAGDNSESGGAQGFSAAAAERVIRAIYVAAATDDCATITKLSTAYFQETLGCDWLSAMRGTIEVKSVMVNITDKDPVDFAEEDGWTSKTEIETSAFDGTVGVTLVRGQAGWLVGYMDAY